MTIDIYGAADILSNTVKKIWDSVLYTKEQRFNHTRNAEMRRLYQQTHVTSEDILKAEFGGSVPNGLDIRKFPDFECTFESLEGFAKESNMTAREIKRELRLVAGRGGADERIYLNPYYDKVTNGRTRQASRLAKTIGHEHVHRLQGVERHVGWQSAFDNNRMAFLHAPVEGDNAILREGHSLCRNFMRAVMDIKSGMNVAGEMKISNYLAKEYEVQARLHEILTEGYAAWQKMPTTKLELWAALGNAGLKMPDSIRQELSSSVEGRQAVRDFSMSHHAKQQIAFNVSDLNKVYHFGVHREAKETFWETALPGIYGNLLELYGDELGRARMDMGVNPVPAKDIMAAMKRDDVNIDAQQIRDMVDAMPPVLADELLTNIIRRINSADEAYFSKADMVIDALFDNPDTRDVLLNRNDYVDMRHQTNIASWQYACLYGDIGVLERYAKAGFNFCTNEQYNIGGSNSSSLEGLVSAYQNNIKYVDYALRTVDEWSLHGAFEQEALIQNIQNSAAWQRDAFQFIADHAPDPDALVEGSDKSIRDLMESIGIAPKNTEAARLSVKQTVSHAAEDVVRV